MLQPDLGIRHKLGSLTSYKNPTVVKGKRDGSMGGQMIPVRETARLAAYTFDPIIRSYPYKAEGAKHHRVIRRKCGH